MTLHLSPHGHSGGFDTINEPKYVTDQQLGMYTLFSLITYGMQQHMALEHTHTYY